jgi:exonuclease III
MIGVSWNIRSLRKPGRKQALTDAINEYKFDFIGLQEIKTEHVDVAFLNSISGSLVYTWLSLPAKKTAGGILVGVRNDKFDVIASNQGSYFVSALLVDKLSSFTWHLVMIYGTAYSEFKLDFFSELHDILSTHNYPILLGGDFNLVRDTRKVMTHVMLTGPFYLMTGSINGVWLNLKLLIDYLHGLITNIPPFWLLLTGFLPRLIGRKNTL